jgi:cytochrome c-type biogenesis protein CcmH
VRTRLILGIVGVLMMAAAGAIDSDEPIEDPGQAALYERLIHEVRCLVCQNQTIGDSTAPLAADLRKEIRRMVVEGKSEAEIEQFLLERYGDFVLYRPRFQASTAPLWLAPLLLLGAGALTLILVLRRRATLPHDIDADDDADSQAPQKGP